MKKKNLRRIIIIWCRWALTGLFIALCSWWVLGTRELVPYRSYMHSTVQSISTYSTSNSWEFISLRSVPLHTIHLPQEPIAPVILKGPQVRCDYDRWSSSIDTEVPVLGKFKFPVNYNNNSNNIRFQFHRLSHRRMVGWLGQSFSSQRAILRLYISHLLCKTGTSREVSFCK